MEAMLLVNGIELQAWFDARMKRYVGQAQIKRIIEYLIRTISE